MKNLKPAWALEIKWSNQYAKDPQKLKSLLAFCKENNLTQALVTTLSYQDVKEVQGVQLSFIPCATYAYTVGLNTIMK